MQQKKRNITAGKAPSGEGKQGNEQLRNA